MTWPTLLLGDVAEAEGRVVGQGNRFRRGPERHSHQDGAKNLHLGNRACGLDIGQKSRRIEPASTRKCTVWLVEGCSFGHALSDQLGDAIELNFVDDRTDIDGFVEWVANSQSVHSVSDLGVQFLGDSFLNQ